ncbi:ABC transporter ATP-binding protein [Mesorhizobium wenxiniae]|uniref:Spermidine/putrescine import ATP-binding protein PotA n=1 Tax=Mesorhizobium wenxiniae TaxID=2014805 RepID=A0A271KAK1_9HYPH|nr:ABC transporter ATP-binding protein [Mesorhizobium wenxiniae]PAP92075.1 hypothetical protein CIT31_29245 [Mesorhizobium wenxiniae]
MTYASVSVICQLINVSKSYGDKVFALDNIDLDIVEGELLSLLGPSGSGKTTALMLLAGFQDVTSGSILFRGKPLNKKAPHLRNFGVVFQNYALFPHMTVSENICFPLKMRGVEKVEMSERCRTALDMVHMVEYANRKPTQLSGGQQQRVALARALIFNPEMLLLDEPLGALDKNLREEMQYEIRSLHDRLGITMISVTHDQTEALSMSDRIAVFCRGRIEQIGSPKELYNAPATQFVAGFLGETNFLPAKVIESRPDTASVLVENSYLSSARFASSVPAGSQCMVAVRPERVRITTDRNDALRIPAIVKDAVFVGSTLRVVLTTMGGTEVTLLRMPWDTAEIRLGEKVEFGWDDDAAIGFPHSPSESKGIAVPREEAEKRWVAVSEKANKVRRELRPPKSQRAQKFITSD